MEPPYVPSNDRVNSAIYMPVCGTLYRCWRMMKYGTVQLYFGRQSALFIATYLSDLAGRRLNYVMQGDDPVPGWRSISARRDAFNFYDSSHLRI